MLNFLKKKKKNIKYENDIVAEIMERNSRMNDMILFNLPETLNKDASSDCDQIQSILDKMYLQVKYCNASRLGVSKTPSDRPGPIKVHFSNPYDVGLVLRSQRKLSSIPEHKDLRFVTDRTLK